jgi:8-hydroxy-5-deazaflavin:NADPH oxidoreductase
VRVAIVGGTGAFGRALTERLAALGYDVVIGSRDAQRAAELAAVYGVEGKANPEAVRGVDLVVLATKSNATLDTARDLADAIGPTPVLCVASDLRFEKDGVLPGRLGTSLAEEVAEILAGPVAAGLQSLAAVHLTQRDAPDQDALICGDDLGAKRIALELADSLVAGRAIDAGPLANARALEGLTAIILNVNKRYRAHAGIRITGLE